MSADARYGRLDGRERRNLKELEKRLSGAVITPRAVGDTLPEAVLSDNTNQQKLSKSMVDVTEQAIALSVQENPQALSTALFPIIGSAIRKAINRLLSETMVRMNAGLEKTFSLRRIAWRFEAWRKGVPFMEIVLRNTLAFRVEHVFLIHRRTGILLHDLSLPQTLMADKDMVASMLTVVQNYIRDSLKLQRKSDTMQSLTAGDYSFIVEDGPLAILALIVRGTPDPSLREIAQDALETVHLRMARELSEYSGDTGAFTEAETYMRPCLVSRDKDGGRKIPVYSLIALAVVLAAVGFFAVRGLLRGRERDAFVERLRAAPGIVVTDVARRGGGVVVEILRDIHADDPSGYAPDGVSVIAREFLSLEPEFVLRRLELVLQPPPSVGLRYEKGVLYANGPAPDEWVRGRLPLAYAAGGVSEVRYSREPVEKVLPEQLRALAAELSSRTVLFEKDSVALLPGQEALLENIRVLIHRIVESSRGTEFTPRIEIVGHAAGTVQDDESVRVSTARALKAEEIFSALDAKLKDYMFPRGAGSAEPVVPEILPEDKAKNRSVTFRAVFR